MAVLAEPVARETVRCDCARNVIGRTHVSERAEQCVLECDERSARTASCGSCSIRSSMS